MSSAAGDPYLDPASGVLRNLLGITDAAELARAEAALSASRLIDLERRRLPGRYDLAHLQAFHRYILGGIYGWAGQLRTVSIAKGSVFCLHRVSFSRLRMTRGSASTCVMSAGPMEATSAGSKPPNASRMPSHLAWTTRQLMPAWKTARHRVLEEERRILGYVIAELLKRRGERVCGCRVTGPGLRITRSAGASLSADGSALRPASMSRPSLEAPGRLP